MPLFSLSLQRVNKLTPEMLAAHQSSFRLSSTKVCKGKESWQVPSLPIYEPEQRTSEQTGMNKEPIFSSAASTDPAPSKEDYDVTDRSIDAGKLIGIDVLDHIVMARQGCVSIMEQRNRSMASST